MALIVEDGTGKVDAEAYRSLADHKAYCDKRGIAYSNSDTTLEQQARKAVDYLTNVYRERWKGFRTTNTQALDWPRAEVEKLDGRGGYNGYPNYYDYNSVPTEIGDAQSELMIRVAVAPLAPDIGRIKESVKIGPLAVTYDKDAPAYTSYVAVESKLRPFLIGSSINAQVIRT